MLAVYLGVIVGAFKAYKWLPAIPRNFPELEYCDGKEKHRSGFQGSRAPDDIWKYYVGDHGKRIEGFPAISSQSPFFIRTVNFKCKDSLWLMRNITEYVCNIS